MRLNLLALFFALATRNERSAMVRLCNTRAGRRLYVRAGNLAMTFGAPPSLPVWFRSGM